MAHGCSGLHCNQCLHAPSVEVAVLCQLVTVPTYTCGDTQQRVSVIILLM